MLILGISDDVQISGHANAEGGKQRLAFVRIGNESFVADRILLTVIYLSMASPETGHFTCGTCAHFPKVFSEAGFITAPLLQPVADAPVIARQEDSWHYLHLLLLRSKDTHIRLLWLPSFAA